METKSKEKGGSLGSSTVKSPTSLPPSSTPVARKARKTPGRKTKHPFFKLSEAANFSLQTIALIAALAFGAWAIKSYNATLAGNNLANQAYLATLAGNNITSQAFNAALQANDLSQQSLEMTNNSNQGNNKQAALQMQLSQSQLQHISAQAQIVLAAAQLSLLQYCESSSKHSDTDLCSSIIAAAPLASIATALLIFNHSSDSNLNSNANSSVPTAAVGTNATMLSISSISLPRGPSTIPFNLPGPPSTTSALTITQTPTTSELITTGSLGVNSPTSSRSVPLITESPTAIMALSSGGLSLGGLFAIIVGLVLSLAIILVYALYRIRRREVPPEVG